MLEFSVVCEGRERTRAIAAALAPLLQPGDAMLLKGPLASGKTAFVQELVAALGSKAEVTSPTFTLAQFYTVPSGTFMSASTSHETVVNELITTETTTNAMNK